jgi:hypothetical protein
MTWFVALGILAYTASSASADSQQTGSGGGTGSAGSNGSVGFSQTAQLSLSQQLGAATAIVSQIATDSASLQKGLTKAHNDGDVIETNCFDNLLSQMNAALASATSAQQSLQLSGGGEGAAHYFTILSVLAQRAAQLMTESSQCVPGYSNYNEQTQTTMGIDPGLAPDQPGNGPGSILPVDIPTPPPVNPVTNIPIRPPPPCVSPTQ